MTTSVFVIDDHPVVAQGVALVLEDGADLTFAGGAASLADALEPIGASRPDVVLLDVRLPDSDVVSAVQAVLRVSGGSRIALFTSDPGHPHVRPAEQAGARTTIAKDVPPARLRELIVALAAGETIEGVRHRTTLTPRQYDVLCRVATGMTNTAIADALHLQPTTVKAYWQETMQRLCVRNRAEAIAAAYRDGLL